MSNVSKRFLSLLLALTLALSNVTGFAPTAFAEETEVAEAAVVETTEATVEATTEPPVEETTVPETTAETEAPETTAETEVPETTEETEAPATTEEVEVPKTTEATEEVVEEDEELIIVVSDLIEDSKSHEMAALTGLTVENLGVEYTDLAPVKTGDKINATQDWKADGTTISNEIVMETRAKAVYTVLTLTNNMDVEAHLAFRWEASKLMNGTYICIGTDEYLLNNATALTGSGNKDIKLAAGENVTITIQTAGLGKGDEETVSLKLMDLKLYVDKAVTTTFVAADPIQGSYTVNGEEITEDTAISGKAADVYNVVAIPAEGYAFAGWYSETEQDYLATDLEASFTLAEDQKVYPLFMKTEDAIWAVGDTCFMELEDAIDCAQRSDNKVVALKRDYTLTEDATIPKGITLLIPFDEEHTCYLETPAPLPLIDADGDGHPDNSLRPWQAPYAYRTLTLGAGVELTVEGGLSVSAVHHGGQANVGTPTGPCGFVQTSSNSQITVANGGSLYAWGYIVGSGKVEAESGAAVYELIQITDFRGGSASFLFMAGSDTPEEDLEQYVVMPFNQYYVQNVEIPLTLHSGSREVVYTSIFVSGTNQSLPIDFIGTNKAMFRMDSGASITKKYNGTSDRLVIDVEGDVNLNGMTVVIPNYFEDGISTEMFNLPITNNITINVNSGTTTVAQNVALQAGAELNIDKGAALYLEEDWNLFVYDRDEWIQNRYCYSNAAGTIVHMQPVVWSYANGKNSPRTVDGLTDAKVNINGVLEADGYIYSTRGGANICSTEGTGMLMLWNGSGEQENTYQAIQNGTKIAFDKIPLTATQLKNADGTNTSTEDCTMGGYIYDTVTGTWLDAITVDFNGNGGTGSVGTMTVDALDVADGIVYESGYNEITLPANGFTKANATFKEWNTKADGTGESYQPGDTYAVTGNVTLYAIWKIDLSSMEYDVTYEVGDGYILQNGEEIEDTSVSFENVKYGTELTVLEEDGDTYEFYHNDRMVFAGWNTKANGSGDAYAPGAKLEVTGDVTLYAQWKMALVNNVPVDPGEYVTNSGKLSTTKPTDEGYAYLTYDESSDTATLELNELDTRAGIFVKYCENVHLVLNGTNTLHSIDVLDLMISGEGNLTANMTLCADLTLNGGKVNAGNVYCEIMTLNAGELSGDKLLADGYDDETSAYLKEGAIVLNNGMALVSGELNYDATAKNWNTTDGFKFAKPESYTVTWIANGKELSKSAVATGTVPVTPANPAKDKDADNHYSFAGWSDSENGAVLTALPAVTKDATYYAIFTAEAHEFKEVSRIDSTCNTAGSVTKQCACGEPKTETLKLDPTKHASEEIVYKNVKADTHDVYHKCCDTLKTADVAHTYTDGSCACEAVQTFLVTWVNEAGETVDTETVEYGKNAIKAPAVPAKEGFTAEWDQAAENVKSNLTIAPKYTVITFTVTWVNEAGETVDSEIVEYGKDATKAPAVPEKTGYTGAWDKEAKEVKSDLTIKPVYTIQSYDITWNVEGATTTIKVEYNQIPSYGATDPTKATEGCITYTFAGWSLTANGTVLENLPAATGPETYYAVFTTGSEHKFTMDRKGSLKDEGDCLTKAKYAYMCDYCEVESETLVVEGKRNLSKHATPDSFTYSVKNNTHDKMYACCSTVIENVPHSFDYRYEFMEGNDAYIAHNAFCVCGAKQEYELHAENAEGYCGCGAFQTILDLNGGKLISAPETTRLYDWNIPGDAKNHLGITEEDIAFYNSIYVKDGYKIVGFAYDAAGTQPYNGEVYTGPTTFYFAWECAHLNTTATDNGDGTHKVVCSNGHVLEEKAEHNFENEEHKCVCGKVESFTVTWVDEDGKIVATETVEYGKDATKAPVVTEKTGCTGVWDKEAKEVKSDLTIKPVYTLNEYMLTIEAMDFNMGEGDPYNNLVEVPVPYGAKLADYINPEDADDVVYQIGDIISVSGKMYKGTYTITGWQDCDNEYAVLDMTNAIMPADGITITQGYTYTGWKYTDEGTMYCVADKYIKDTVAHVDGDAYLFDENGFIVAGAGLVRHVTEDGTVEYYYFCDGIGDGDEAEICAACATGEASYTGFKKGIHWIFKNNDLALPNWDYSFDERGVILHHEDTSLQGLHPNGEEITYYIDGVPAYMGLIEIDGAYYYVRSSGNIIKDKTYYISKTNGLLLEGTYDFDVDGKMIIEVEEDETKSGIVAENDGLYYYVDGKLAYAGLIEIDGDYYYVRSNGKLAQNQRYWITKHNDLMKEASYYFDEEGKLMQEGNKIVAEDGGLYYYENGVRTYAGLIKIGDNYYYVRSSGKLAQSEKYWITKHNGLLLEGSYLFDAEGKLVLDAEPGFTGIKDGYYYVNGMKTYAGLIEIDGEMYYVNSTCKVITGRKYWISKTNNLLPEGIYEFDADGKMI